ncbi:glutathione S-transferase L1-like [Macadamia integrifolia]|uniref:glutathione S-transferase L1-like n=1 Tax=Macadamia integrifolia TaxID=60698 RepID=UPI001C529AE7|nr:glutathione S-transferase L1-like [Macadamia integrifolia]
MEDPSKIATPPQFLQVSGKCGPLWMTRSAGSLGTGLQDKIKLVGIDLQNRPAWYKEKVNPANKVPALEHNNKIITESLDLIKYVDSNFEGPVFLPDVDIAYAPFVERFQLLLLDMKKYDITAGRPKLTTWIETLVARMVLFQALPAQDVRGLNSNGMERRQFNTEKTSLSRVFLARITKIVICLIMCNLLVDIAYAPFVERFQLLLLDMKKYDITAGRPKLTTWIEEMDKIEAYKQTKWDPHELITALKRHLSR